MRFNVTIELLLHECYKAMLFEAIKEADWLHNDVDCDCFDVVAGLLMNTSIDYLAIRHDVMLAGKYQYWPESILVFFELA